MYLNRVMYCWLQSITSTCWLDSAGCINEARAIPRYLNKALNRALTEPYRALIERLHRACIAPE